MKKSKNVFVRAAVFFVILTVLCGVLYTGAVTGIATVFFPEKAAGSIIEVNGVKYGSTLLAQEYTKNNYLWGRMMILDTETFVDENGNPLLYAKPSNM
ncbi:MAG: potassium-transporting ATPase subunit C, partial [Oscillospiraceae bacterium]